PASPRQVLSVATRLLEGSQLQQQRVAQDFAARFGALTRMRMEASSWRDYFALYDELVDWDLRLHDAGESGLADSLTALLSDVRREFGAFVARSYGGWVAREDRGGPRGRGEVWRGRHPVPGDDRPPLSTDVVQRFLAPALAEAAGPVVFMVIDCLRLDQWRVLRPLLIQDFDVTEELYSSILPTATPYARNALFSGQFPDEIARDHPGWWGTDEGSLNAFEDELFGAQLERLLGRRVPVTYEKVFTDAEADEIIGRVRTALRGPGVIALVFNFVDMLTHGRSESAILMEVARDVVALRKLTRQWFEASAAYRVLREAAAAGATVVLTTDHGSIHCQRPVTVYARRDATSNLRYKFGMDLRAEEPGAVYAVTDEREIRFPPGRMATNYVLALEDYFFVYPTRLREYQARYRGSFLHGGVSPEEMILPVVTLRPRG
ncbi:MAG TPA: PglZ domain-containing protein, partial [Longimicrobiales bacterium]|nr:PglZ domain-containing protein [Longimicrobiales bacterium]